MSTPAQRLQFLVEFAQMDLATLRPGDWLNLRDDLMSFLGMGMEGFARTDTAAIIGDVTQPPFPDSFPEASFRSLQAEIAAILRAMLDDRGGEQTHAHPGTTPIAIEYVLRSADSGAPHPWYNAVYVLGATRDVCLHIFFHLLAHVRTTMILRCPECGTIFYRRRNQDYCSRPCVNRVSQRRFRARHEAETVSAAAR